MLFSIRFDRSINFIFFLMTFADSNCFIKITCLRNKLLALVSEHYLECCLKKKNYTRPWLRSIDQAGIDRYHNQSLKPCVYLVFFPQWRNQLTDNRKSEDSPGSWSSDPMFHLRIPSQSKRHPRIMQTLSTIIRVDRSMVLIRRVIRNSVVSTREWTYHVFASVCFFRVAHY